MYLYKYKNIIVISLFYLPIIILLKQTEFELKLYNIKHGISKLKANIHIVNLKPVAHEKHARETGENK